jgi:hypothetical protein
MRTRLVPLAVLCLLATACTKKALPADAGAEGGSGTAAAASLAFLGEFEGEIDGFTKDSSKPGGQPIPLQVFVKAGKVKVEVPEALAKSAGPMLGEKAYGIFDSTAKKLTVVTDAKKEAIVIDLNSSGKTFQTIAPGAHGGPSNATPSKITKTTKTDTVAGYPCTYWDITSDHKEGTVCVGDDGPSWFSLPTTGIPSASAWMADLVDGKHFPLRFIGYGKDGTTEEQRVEVTKIDKKSLADTEFQVPAGYKTIDLEKMFQGMPGGMPGMPGGGGLPIPPHPPVHR